MYTVLSLSTYLYFIYCIYVLGRRTASTDSPQYFHRQRNAEVAVRFYHITPMFLCVCHIASRYKQREWGEETGRDRAPFVVCVRARAHVFVRATPIERAFHAAASVAHAWCTWDTYEDTHIRTRTYTQRRGRWKRRGRREQRAGAVRRHWWRSITRAGDRRGGGTVGVHMYTPMVEGGGRRTAEKEWQKKEDVDGSKKTS